MRKYLLLTLLFGLFLLPPLFTYAQTESELKKAVMQGISDLEDFAKTQQNQLEEKLREQKEIRRRAIAGQTAKDPKVAQENRQAVGVIEQAIALTEKGLETVNAKLKRLLSVHEIYIDMRAEYVRIYYNTHGGHRNGRPIEIKPGETFRNTSDEIAEVITSDGQILQIGPNTTLTLLKPQPPSSSGTMPRIDIEFRNVPIWKLMEGKLHYFLMKLKGFPCEGKPGGAVRACAIRTPTLIVSVRGTEFDLQVDDGGLTHLIPYDGTIEMIADQDKIDRSKINRWWETAQKRSGDKAAESPSATEIPKGTLLRVVSVQGNVRVKKDAVSEPRVVVAGDTLKAKETLLTGENGLVKITFQGGMTGDLRANSKLQAAQKEGSAEPIYALWAGTLHLLRDANSSSDKSSPAFITPNAILSAIPGAELEMSVDQSGLSSVTPYAGQIEITAKIDRLEEAKITRWWDEMYK